MITGDSKETAVAIAREVNIFGILEDVADSAYSSKEFFALPFETQMTALKKGNKVFCRAEPKDKQILISMLEKLGEVTGQSEIGQVLDLFPASYFYLNSILSHVTIPRGCMSHLPLINPLFHLGWCRDSYQQYYTNFNDDIDIKMNICLKWSIFSFFI